MATKTTTVKKNVSPEETTATPEKAPAVEKPAKKPVVKKFTPDQYVTVRNGFQGRLVYKSPKTGERFIWDEFGAEQDMEISELRSARNSAKKFFIYNWFMFDDPEVVEYLGMSLFYKFAIPIDNFDDLFKKTPEEVKEVISHLSEGQKKSVAYRARRLIADGSIDSIRVIRAIEDALGVELIER